MTALHLIPADIDAQMRFGVADAYEQLRYVRIHNAKQAQQPRQRSSAFTTGTTSTGTGTANMHTFVFTAGQ